MVVVVVVVVVGRGTNQCHHGLLSVCSPKEILGYDSGVGVALG